MLDNSTRHLKLGVGLKVDTLGDAWLQVGNSLLQQFGLDLINLANGLELLDTVLAQLDIDGKVGQVLVDLSLDLLTTASVGFEVDVRGSDNSRLSLKGGTDDLVGEFGTGLGHGEGGRTSSSLGLDDLVTSELDSVHKSTALFRVPEKRGGKGGLALGKQGQNRVSSVSSDDGDDVLGGLGRDTND